MILVTTVAHMQAFAAAAIKEGKSIAFVPTMGYLHEGHASLMREGRRRGDILVLSIFVNPAQFGAGEDFATYPRNLEGDCALAQAAGVDVVFAPTATEMYPEGYQTYINVERVSLPLCGANRPGHFRGVTTVVAKLFNIVMPTTALFGSKDYQQLAVIRRMVADLNMTVEIVPMPIVREEDGLAMSSRNAYLSPVGRRSALCLSRALAAAGRGYAAGERGAASLVALAREEILREPDATIEYVELRHGQTLEEIAEVGQTAVLALAVKIGTTRLIDNCTFGEE